MPRKRCPGMDPANFKPGDVTMHPCPGCGNEIEFWKDDVRLTCGKCGRAVFNPNLGTTCLSWCKSAAECVGSADIHEWLRRRTSRGTEEP